jgi:hypothetical protein
VSPYPKLVAARVAASADIASPRAIDACALAALLVEHEQSDPVCALCGPGHSGGYRLADIYAERAAHWEAVMLLGSPAAVAAGRAWFDNLVQLRHIAQGMEVGRPFEAGESKSMLAAEFGITRQTTRLKSVPAAVRVAFPDRIDAVFDSRARSGLTSTSCMSQVVIVSSWAARITGKPDHSVTSLP